MLQNFQIQLPKEVTLTEMDGKLVLFSKKNGDFFGLNESAAFFVQTLLKNSSVDTLALASQAFAAPESELQTDLIDLVDHLESLRLIHKVAAT